ncbi:MAG TPA: LLM class flavin-dependent oxidoreductase [Ilumatobacter sp.]|nr:LLM class flavin-dependent oxidoreductase [Ilumatobacter sp.]
MNVPKDLGQSEQLEPGIAPMRHGLYLAPFEELAEPAVLAELGVAAEQHGWDGLFMWDHVYRPPEETTLIGDTWISAAALAVRTERLQIGATVTPVTRRRPQLLARESVAVDRLSQGRLIVGLGLGVDIGGELSRFGEVVDPVVRGERLDEGAELLLALWSGEEVNFTGKHFQAEGVRFLPTSVRQPHPPLWFAARGVSGARPVRRAARLGDGLHLIEIDAEGLSRVAALVAELRGSLDGFDFAVTTDAGTGGAQWSGTAATWLLQSFAPTATAAQVEAVITAGPPR